MDLSEVVDAYARSTAVLVGAARLASEERLDRHVDAGRSRAIRSTTPAN